MSSLCHRSGHSSLHKLLLHHGGWKLLRALVRRPHMTQTCEDDRIVVVCLSAARARDHARCSYFGEEKVCLTSLDTELSPRFLPTLENRVRPSLNLQNDSNYLLNLVVRSFYKRFCHFLIYNKYCK
jgi:hypothetical protein